MPSRPPASVACISLSPAPGPVCAAGTRQAGAGGHAPGGAVQVELLEAGWTPLVRACHQLLAVELEQVEDRIHDRCLGGEPRDRGSPGYVHPPLQPLEARPAVIAERDDLAIE